jgi:hypothetical protein
MEAKQDLIDEWAGMIHEGQTRTFCRPEHEAGYARRMNRLESRCKAAGFDPTDIGKAAMKSLMPNAAHDGRRKENA